jgi:hypothetical protein
MNTQKTDYGLTGVFYANWTAIHARNEDGSRKYKYIVNTGSSRSAKTWSINEVKHQLCEQNEGWRVTSWRDTKTDCKKTVWKDFQKMLIMSNRMDYKKLNKTESIYSYSTGSTFEIHGTDNEENVHGLTQEVAHLNEPYNISKYTFDQIDMRSDCVIIDWNPRKSHWIDDVSKLPNAIVIHSTFEDNTFCPVEQRKKILSYEPLKQIYKYLLSMPELEADKEVDSLGVSDFEKFHIKNSLQNEYNSTSDAWMWSVYGLGEKAERPNRIFKFKEIPDKDYFDLDKPIYYGVDWGKVHNMGVLEVKAYDNDIYVHEINYKSEDSLRNDLNATERLQVDKSKDEGFVEWLFLNKFDIPFDRPVVCDNNRKHKILALRNIGYDYAIACRKFPGSLLDNIDLLTNINVYYTKSSTNIKYEQENYSRKVDKRSGEVLEEPEDKDDHLMQPLSYVVRNLYDNEVLRKF